MQLIRFLFSQIKNWDREPGDSQAKDQIQVYLTPNLVLLISGAVSLELSIFFPKILKMKSSGGLGIGPQEQSTNT